MSEGQVRIIKGVITYLLKAVLVGLATGLTVTVALEVLRVYLEVSGWWVLPSSGGWSI